MAGVSSTGLNDMSEERGKSGKKHAAECFVVDFSDNMKSDEKKANLQESFIKFKKQRQKELRDEKRLRDRRMRQQGNKCFINKLRKKFIKRAKKYYGTPYARKYWSPETPEYRSKRFLDCCGLVRQVMWDLRKDFGFKLGPWNQAYMFDLLPIEVEKEEDMKPGDLVFMSGVYPSPKARQQKHFMTHVEIWAGDGKTIGARWNNGKVQLWDSYKFEAKSFQNAKYHFRSIDTWLKGICRSFCPEHKWGSRGLYNTSKKSIFSLENQKKKTEDKQDQEPKPGDQDDQENNDDDLQFDDNEDDDMKDSDDEMACVEPASPDSDLEDDMFDETSPRQQEGEIAGGDVSVPKQPQQLSPLTSSANFVEDVSSRLQPYEAQILPKPAFSYKKYHTQIGFALSLNTRKEEPSARSNKKSREHNKKLTDVNSQSKFSETGVLVQRMATMDIADRYRCTPQRRELSTPQHPGRRDSGVASVRLMSDYGSRFPIIYNDDRKHRFDLARGIEGRHIEHVPFRAYQPKLQELSNHSQTGIKLDTPLCDSTLSFTDSPRNCETVTPRFIELFEKNCEETQHLKEGNGQADKDDIFAS